MSSTPSARVIAVHVLSRVLDSGRALDDAYSDAKTTELSTRDQALVKELCFGTLRWYPRLDALLKRLLRKPLKAKDADVRSTLLIGLYQLGYMRTPAHAAIHATVEVTRDLHKPWARGLVNGILRRLQREAEVLLEKVDQDPAARAAHPPWLFTALSNAYPQDWQAIVAANNKHPPMTLRVNIRQGGRDAYLAALSTLGIKARGCQYADTGITLDSPKPPTQLPGFGDGRVSVQDAAAQLCAGLLDLHPGQRVLDACAAPGGKTGHILESEPGLRELVALDRVSARLGRLRDNLQRLRLSATVSDGDALRPDDWWDGVPFDRILLDAPCSGSGVIRRHPDIKVLRRASDVGTLALRQSQILEALWPLLTPKGILLYVTCSILHEENGGVVQPFLDATGDARELPITAPWGRSGGVGRSILPGEADMDGFFFARLVKD